MTKMLIQGPGGTLRAQNWALRPLPSFSAYKLGLETASTSSWFSKKGFAGPSDDDNHNDNEDKGFNNHIN